MKNAMSREKATTDLVLHEGLRAGDGRGGGRDGSEEGVVSGGEDHAHGVSRGKVAARLSHVLGLAEIRVVGLHTNFDVHVLARQRGAVHLEVRAGQHVHIGRDLLASSHLDDVSRDQRCRVDILQSAVAVHEDGAGSQRSEGRHDLVGLALLDGLESGGHQHDDHEHDAQSEGLHIGGIGDAVHDEAQN
jgi:hypothetical protein